MKSKAYIEQLLSERILLLDGGMGTMVQRYGLTEEDYRGERFAEWPTAVKGCNDLLVLTRPEVIAEIHDAYYRSGADIVSTCSFNANAVSMADYGLQEYVAELNRAAAQVAREVADRYTASNPSKPRLVAGSMGPTNRTASVSADVNNPAAREVTFEELAATYEVQARALIEGGVDLLLLETVFDTLNAKAAIYAIKRLGEHMGAEIPLMISCTLADASGRTLTGQTVEAFYASVAHAEPLTMGLNCAYGARQMLPYLERLAEVSECGMSAHPNAGLPNVMGGYDETPEMFARDAEEYLRRGLINIVGGCCGTTPEHIFELSKIVTRYAPRPKREKAHICTLSGLEQLRVVPEANFINVGERTNVAGSAKFARLVREGNFEEAMSVARAQVEAGAQVIDVCMDDGMIDAEQAMCQFLNLAAAEPEIARVPVMIDSSKWEVLTAGLRCAQGKCVVNSISLKEGEEVLREHARELRRYGAAAVVMLFDERGQADTYERKVEVAERAYKILTDESFPAEDIIFDPNILAVATGIEEHDRYGVDFIEATRWIKQNLPYAKVSGGVSNLSFAFRGNNAVREAMHSVFLYHARQAGMDMGIVNPAMLQIYESIDAELLERVEDVVLARRADAAERLTELATDLKQQTATAAAATEQWREGTLAERVEWAMLKGVTEHIEADALEGYNTLGSPLAVIDQLLMPAMEHVGRLFGEGKMFLPQVVKSARVMKRAVGVLTPYIEQGATEGAKSAGRFLIATVKGDVHDIGKNIVSVVVACNGFEVKDLGVMVEATQIVDEAVAWQADAIGLSGLITPSLDEMIRVLRELEARGEQIPVIVGGATTSAVHTAVKMATEYSGVVIHSRDASDNARILNRLMGEGREEYLAEVRAEQQHLREEFEREQSLRNLVPLKEARRRAHRKGVEEIVPVAHKGRLVFHDMKIEQVEEMIDWNFFFPAWGLKGRYPEIFDHPRYGEEARKVFDDAQTLLAKIKEENSLRLQGVVGLFEAVSEGDDIVITDPKGRRVRMAQLRSQTPDEQGECLSIADYVISAKTGAKDHIALFALSAGAGLKELTEKYRSEGDDYNAMLAKLLADRLTEAMAEVVHLFVRREMWGYESCSEQPDPKAIIAGKYQGLRMAFGYPATPDHSLKREAFDLLNAQLMTEMRLTENFMIDPGEALCGMMVADEAARYFAVGAIDEEQLKDYAKRRNLTKEQMRKILPKNI